jgi:hypothetical protein
VPKRAVALVSALLATIIAVTVPVMTFRLALRQDAIRWLRERRADLYVDHLAEAHAERQYLEFAIADEETRGAAQDRFTATDNRLLPLERARLGARGTIFASQTVNRLFNRLMAEGGLALLNFDRLHPDSARLRAWVSFGDIMDELEAAVRHELGADRIQPGRSRPRKTEPQAASVTRAPGEGCPPRPVN